MVLNKITYILFILFVCFFISCENKKDKKENPHYESVTLKYAKRFKISKKDGYTILELLGNKNNQSVTSTFVLYQAEKPKIDGEIYFIKTPVNKVACMSSIYLSMIEKLNAINSIVAIDNADYYTNSDVIEKVNQTNILELSKGPYIEVEKTLALNPDLIFSFGMGDPNLDMDKKIIQANIPVAISLDHLEETPLARAEWLKFFACFYNKEAEADSLFKITENNYLSLKKINQELKNKPSVLTEIKYGDTWYVPGGNSYIANLLNDAGANYFWKEDLNSGSVPLNFEMVYSKAKNCEYWINLYNVNSKKDLLAYDSRYGLFGAYKKNKLFNNNKTQNKKGYSNYWETGITNPDELLADLIFIFSPKSLPDHTLKYYKQIE